MVQVLKEAVRRDILKCAKQEFLSKGFRQTSMEQIARKAKITAANIYRYFENKDALFEELVHPVVKRWQFLFNRIETNVIPQAYSIGMDVKKFDTAMLSEEIAFIDSHRDELHLLFFCASGSKRENFLEEITDKIAQANCELLQAIRKANPQVKEIPFVLLHVFASMKVNLYREIIRNNLPKDNIRSLFDLLLLTTQKGLAEQANK